MKILRWVVFGLILFCAIGALSVKSIPSLCIFLIIAALVIPSQRVQALIDTLNISVKAKIIVGLILFVIGMAIFGASTPEAKKARSDQALADAAAAKIEAEKAALEKRKAAKEKEMAAQEEAARLAKEKKSGLHCLSSWDGSNRSFSRQIQDNLREPKSFEHIETRIGPINEKSGQHIVFMKYRARNGFGGMNVAEAIGTVDGSTCNAAVVTTGE